MGEIMTLTEYERDKVVQSLIKAAGDTGEYPTDDEIEIAYEKARRAKGMTDDEKNEVLLRFAGFTYGLATDALWHYPDGGSCWPDPPDTTDLTTLFKWCVPKLALPDRMAVMVKFAMEGRYTGEVLRDAILSLIGEDDGE